MSRLQKIQYAILVGIFISFIPYKFDIANNQINEIPQQSGYIYFSQKEMEYLEKLKECESSNREFVLGDNGLAYGLFQFHQGTFYTYGKKYKLLPEDIEYHEVLNLIFDKDLQTELTSKMLEEDGGWRHWYICSKKIGLDKVDWKKIKYGE